MVLALTALVDRSRSRRLDSALPLGFSDHLDPTPEEEEEDLHSGEAGEADEAAIHSALDDLDRDTAILEERRRKGLPEDAGTTARIQRHAVSIKHRLDLQQAQSEADDAAQTLLQKLHLLLNQFREGSAAAYSAQNSTQLTALSNVIVWGHLWIRRECRVDQLDHALQMLVEHLPQPSSDYPTWMTIVRELAAQTQGMRPLLDRLSKLEVLVGATGEEAQLLHDVTG